MDAAAIEAEVERLGPWVTGFMAHGRAFGGQYFAENDSRVQGFLRWMGPRKEAARRLLECGSLDGGHTAALASALPQAKIVATDIRDENLERAKLLARVRGLTNIEFRRDDLEEPAKSLQETYDAIFCVGLLYHLRDPAKFLNRASKSAPVLWLWTVYCPDNEANVAEGRYRGRIYAEPTAHPLSGIRAESYFPTLGSLVEMSLAAGYERVEVMGVEITKYGNGPAVLLCANRG